MVENEGQDSFEQSGIHTEDTSRSGNGGTAHPTSRSRVCESLPLPPLVLVVEDREDMNSLLVEVLEEQYRVVAAFDGYQGLQLARALRPDVILSDLAMPQMTGDQLFERLREDPELVRIPVLILTG